MPQEFKPGCARPTGGVVGEKEKDKKAQNDQTMKKEEKHMVLIGRKAPDFTAPAYHKGKFITLQLSEYFGKWILLCFYPGDFTFV
jgi:peroxiredoxin (alkyl hydroperoxide reductase subunit C)